MAGMPYYFGAGALSRSNFKTTQFIPYCSNSTKNPKKASAPQFLKLAVYGVTEILRLFSPGSNRRHAANHEQKEEVLVSGVDDVISILKSDYEAAYFVTGSFTSGIYDEDCLFEDPTIKFRGRDLYSRNLQLLVPFFYQPSILLKDIRKGIRYGTNFVQADWKLTTYLKLPWRPLISIDGSTVYSLDENFRIVQHSESWSVSALEAVALIFTPSFRDRDG